jgi:hypothetical protein
MTKISCFIYDFKLVASWVLVESWQKKINTTPPKIPSSPLSPVAGANFPPWLSACALFPEVSCKQDGEFLLSL